MKKIRSSNIEEIAVGFILALMVVTVSAGVFARYVLDKPLVFSGELARYSNIWLTFFGTALVLKKGEHIVIDFVVNMLGPRVKKWVRIISTAIVMLTIIVLLVYGIWLTKMSHIMITPAFRIPYSYIYIVMPISCFLMLLRVRTWLPRMVKGTESEDEG